MPLFSLVLEEKDQHADEVKIRGIHFGFLVLAWGFSAECRGGDGATVDLDNLRLRTPIKVTVPGGGMGGMNLEVEKWGFINGHGVVVIPPQWEKVAPFREGLAHVMAHDKQGYILSLIHI